MFPTYFRIIHMEGFTESELINYRYMILANYITSYRYVMEGIAQLDISVPPNETVGLAQPFLNVHRSLAYSMPLSMVFV